MTSNKIGRSVDGHADTDPVFAAATEWMVRVHDPDVTPESLIAWQSWMRENPAHAEAFRRMENLDQLLRVVPRPPMAPLRQVARDTYDGSAPIRLWKRHPDQLVPRWALAASALIATIALALLLMVSTGRFSSGRGTTVIATRIGENRVVHLADGSIVTLGGDSRVAVDFRPRERDIGLIRGEAFFSVAHNPTRPFKVSAGGAMVIAVGTQFDVRRDTDQVIVDVVEGRVVVLPRSPSFPVTLLHAFRPRLAAVSVGAGEQTSVDSVEIEPPSQIPDPEDATSWQSGRLAFRMQPLGDVLQQLNRYSSKPIVIADPDIAAMKVTGTVVEGNVSGWVASLRSALGIVAEEQQDRIVLRQVGEIRSGRKPLDRGPARSD
jgi:transmembrane sensor